MSIIEFDDNSSNSIKIKNNTDIKHPIECNFTYFSDEEEYAIKQVYYDPSLLLLSEINISIEDYIYNADYEFHTVYPVIINGINNYVLKKGFIKSEEELVSEIKLQNKAAEFGLADPVFVAYILEDGKEYGLITKKYEETLFRIFDCDYYDIQVKIEYVDRIKIILDDLSVKVKICHGDFHLGNIMIDEKDNLKLVDFEKGSFIDNKDNSVKYTDTEHFTKCGFFLDTITEQVTLDLQNYWYKIMNDTD